MDYYDINQLEPIDKKEFIPLSKKSEASKFGNITVWGDGFGKPGDNIYSLKKIQWINENELQLEFKDSYIYIYIYVYNPKGFYVHNLMIAIKECDKIVWDEISIVKVEYSFDRTKQKIGVNVIKGEHDSSVDINQPCFKLSTW